MVIAMLSEPEFCTTQSKRLLHNSENETVKNYKNEIISYIKQLIKCNFSINVGEYYISRHSIFVFISSGNKAI